MTGTNLQACLPNQLTRLTVMHNYSYGPDIYSIYINSSSIYIMLTLLMLLNVLQHAHTVQLVHVSKVL
jgi:hypothetical protein